MLLQVAITIYSFKARTVFHLNEHKSKSDLISAIEQIPLESSGARIGNALSHVFAENFKLRNGKRPGVPVAILVFADGASRDSVTEFAWRLQNYANVVAIGIKRATENVLQEIATHNRDRRNYFYTRLADQLDTFISEVSAALCNSSAVETLDCQKEECSCVLPNNQTVPQGISFLSLQCDI